MFQFRHFVWRGLFSCLLQMLFPVRALVRGLSMFLVGFAALNLAVEQLSPGFDSNVWWIDLRWLPDGATDLLLALTSVALLMHAFGATLPRRWRLAAVSLIAGAAVIALANAVVFWQLLAQGHIASAAPVPLSLLICVSLILIAIDIRRGSRTPHGADSGSSGRANDQASDWKVPSLLIGALRGSRVVAIAVIFAAVFALGQMYFFGKTDYSRRADAAIVFGARVYADGRMSDALTDRVRTGCDLFHQGLVPRLIFSGGPGDGAVSEPQAMRDFALRSGVPDGAILLDERGLSTQATVDETRRIMADHGITRTLAVSHFYHLPRIKLAYQRETCEVFTVPAKETYTLTALPMYMAREVAAWWWYYLRPVLG